MQLFQSKTRKKKPNILHSLPDVPILVLCRGSTELTGIFQRWNRGVLSGGSRMGRRVKFRVCISPLSLPIFGSVFSGNKRQVAMVSWIIYISQGMVQLLLSVLESGEPQMQILLYFLILRLTTQSLIHPGCVQQTFKHVFNRRHLICLLACMDCVGRLEVKSSLNVWMKWAALTLHWG